MKNAEKPFFLGLPREPLCLESEIRPIKSLNNPLSDLKIQIKIFCVYYALFEVKAKINVSVPFYVIYLQNRLIIAQTDSNFWFI